MYVTTYIVPSHFVYANIPTKTLLTEVDKLFPLLAKNPIADSVAGMGHRYKAGHDLLLDVPSTINNHGFKEGMKHMGHIVLTDFPTKAGIPIPGFSQSGLGELLTSAGIHRGWLQVNISDAGLGVLAISEGASDVFTALNGSLQMGMGTFFDTFVEGSIEMWLGLSTQNPFMLAGGIENFLAGAISTWKTVSVYINPLDFFGSAGFSAILGFGASYGIAGNQLSKAGLDAIRSGIVGSLFSLSSAFGFGALAGFSMFRIGRILAEKQENSLNILLSVNEKEYQMLVDAVCCGNELVSVLLEKALPMEIKAEQVTLQSESIIFPDQCATLDTEPLALPDICNTLETDAESLCSDYFVLSHSSVPLLDYDPPSVLGCYSILNNSALHDSEK